MRGLSMRLSLRAGERDIGALEEKADEPSQLESSSIAR